MNALCQVGSKTENPCENEATVDPFGLGEPFLCSQHFEDKNLTDQQNEWEIARDYVAGFAGLAKVIDLDPLNSVIDLAWAEVEMRFSVIEAERGMLWDR